MEWSKVNFSHPKAYRDKLCPQVCVQGHEAEYEALFVGLRLAIEMKAKKLEIFSNSQLIVNKVISK